MTDLHEAADIIRQEELRPASWANERRLELYRLRAARHMAADPMGYVTRFLAGVNAKQELRARPIPRHRALAVVR